MYKATLALLLSFALATNGHAQETRQEPDRLDLPGPANDDDLSGGIGSYSRSKEDLTDDLQRVSRLLKQHQTDKAIADLTALIAAHPNKAILLSARARAYAEIGDNDRALADIAAALKIDDDLVEPRALRAGIFGNRGMRTAALAEAEKLARDGGDISAQTAAGNIYSSYGEYAKAAQAFDHALDTYDQTGLYLQRSRNRPKRDFAGRMADLEKTIAFVPKDSSTFRYRGNVTIAYGMKGELLRTTGDLPGSLEAYSNAIALTPNSSWALTGRGIVLTMIGKTAEADVDFAFARANAEDEADFNAICAAKAFAGVALASALEDCDVALAATKLRWPVLNTRGLVFLRLGRLDEAIGDFDAVLATDVRPASSYLARAIAWKRKGDAERAATDLAAARAANPIIESEFAYYGITMP